MSKTIEIGFIAQSQALAFLLKQGLTLRDENYSCKQGELDLVMSDNGILVFVEVRKRKHQQYGSGAESVQHSKRSKLIKAATHYLLTQNLYDKVYCRFDIISINQEQKITWLQNVFEQNYDASF